MREKIEALLKEWRIEKMLMCNLLFLFSYSGEKPIESGDSWFPQRLLVGKPYWRKNMR